jgi:hypothetical protein
MTLPVRPSDEARFPEQLQIRPTLKDEPDGVALAAPVDVDAPVEVEALDGAAAVVVVCFLLLLPHAARASAATMVHRPASTRPAVSCLR